MATSRELTLQALQTWENGEEYAEHILERLFSRYRLTAEDRAWVQNAFFGILRRRRGLDFFLRKLRRRKIDRKTRRILHLGLYQIFYTRTPPHAAVNESVALGTGRTAGVINAVLRRAIREQDPLETALVEATPSIRFSLPEALFQKWKRHWGNGVACSLGAWAQSPPECWVRRNGFLWAAESDSPGGMEEGSPLAEDPRFFQVETLPRDLIASGRIYVQDPATRLACELADPRPGSEILDACAAPGGKTFLLAEMAAGQASILATDRSSERLRMLETNARRLQVPGIETRLHDWEAEGMTDREFDVVLADVPCSNTGVMRRKVDVRWRLRAETFTDLPRRQALILHHLVSSVKPGGVLVYSTCSLEPEENRGVIDAFLASHPGWILDAIAESLPHETGLDGSFAARLRRKATE